MKEITIRFIISQSYSFFHENATSVKIIYGFFTEFILPFI